MSMYKYVIFFSILLFSCEKNNSISMDLDSQIYLSLCDNFIPGNTISVLSFNRLSTSSLNSISDVIDVVDPDIIGLQESYEIGLEIADRFDYCFYGNSNASTAILSKYPIEGINDMQSRIIFNDSIYLNFFNVHLTAFPYQPYDIRDLLITTESQAIYQANQTRSAELLSLISLVEEVKNTSTMPIILTGDFNEPSHLDWIFGAENPLYFAIDSSHFTVDWPTSNKIHDLGFIDSYRHIYNNPIVHPGYTWTPYTTLNEVHDRIDFIYYYPLDDLITLESVDIVGPDSQSTILIENYESDHRGLLSVFNIQI
ncbi:MAG: hypothetical protein CMP62_04170 [Flavobacteriales bacterium]|nr:hypothetical protein [Flavobacteriales bacterium]